MTQNSSKVVEKIQLKPKKKMAIRKILIRKT